MVSNKQAVDKFQELETKLHKHNIRNSPKEVSKLLADSFVEFGSSGKIYNKAVTVEGLKNEQTDENIEVEDFTAEYLAESIVLVTYKSTKDTADGKTSSLRSSIWKLIDGNWQMIFHQGTKTQ